MAPKPSQDPPAPLMRRLLLRALELRRHRYLTLPVLLPTRQLLPVAIEHDERRQASGAGLVLDTDRGSGSAAEVGEGLGPKLVVGVGAADGVVGAVGGGGGGVGGGAEGDGGEAAVAFLRVRLPAEDGEPVEGAVLVRVQPEAGQGVEVPGAALVVECAEEGVLAVLEPGGGLHGEVVADQGGEFEIFVLRPLADFGEFLRCEEAVVGVAADEVGLLADRAAVGADLCVC